MRKAVYYTYLGDNGTITTPLHIPGAYGIKKYLLVADQDKRLTKDGVNLTPSVLVPEAEVELWYEIEVGQK